MDTMFEYDGVLDVQHATAAQRSLAIALLSSSRVLASSFGRSLEIQYSGRDAGRWVVRVLAELAGVIRDATGEVRCEFIGRDGCDPCFEFFTIRDGVLWVQPARLVRGERTPYERSR